VKFEKTFHFLLPLFSFKVHLSVRGRNLKHSYIYFEGSVESFTLHSSLFKLHSGGDDRDRTGDLLRARQALSQLSYTPGVWRLEA
jgi:hypothetical protein